MMWAVEEALEKWCPMRKELRNDHCVVNECMMWVWISDDNGYCGLINTPIITEEPNATK